MKKPLLLLIVAALLAISACVPSSPTPTAVPPTPVPETPTPISAATQNPSPTPPATPTDGTYRVEESYPSLRFAQPVLFAVAPGDAADVFVVERTGRIRILEDRPDAAAAPVFLDLSGIVYAKGQEQGLLGLAFHPDYATNGYLYVNYTTAKATVVARYRRSAADPRVADPSSRTVLLTFPQPYSNHNGGMLAFGPDGLLYVGTGDGGSAGDPQNRAQNLSSLLGKILRIDVDHPSDGRAYGIPAGNPFAGNAAGFREEIYAYGLRNPWRFSFDAYGRLWAGDVGQDRMEEIDLVRSGGNYGWSVLEGSLDYKATAATDRSAFAPPVWEYDHSLGEAVTGGYVSMGDALPHLRGAYVYGDYLSGRIWALWIGPDGRFANAQLLDTDLAVSSFGVDARGGLRIVDLRGRIWTLVETTP